MILKKTQTKTCCTLVLKRARPNQSIIFLCKILHFPIEAIPFKKACISQKDCSNTSRSNLTYNEEVLSNKVIYISQKEMYLISNRNAFPNWSKHLEKDMYFQKTKQKECCNTSRGIVFCNEEVLSQKNFKNVSDWSSHLEKGMYFSKGMNAATLQGIL